MLSLDEALMLQLPFRIDNERERGRRKLVQRSIQLLFSSLWIRSWCRLTWCEVQQQETDGEFRVDTSGCLRCSNNRSYLLLSSNYLCSSHSDSALVITLVTQRKAFTNGSPVQSGKTSAGRKCSRFPPLSFQRGFWEFEPTGAGPLRIDHDAAQRHDGRRTLYWNPFFSPILFGV